MKGLAITNIGIEDITASEIRELTSASAEKKKGCAVFDTNNFEDFFRLCYRGQSLRKILFLLSNFKIESLSDIEDRIQKIKLDEWINEKTSFVVRCAINNDKFNSSEVEAETGGFIISKTNAKVDLHEPDTTFFVFIEGEDCYLGIDFSGEDLGKREYRIFTGAEPLKPNVAYALARLAGFKKQETLIDPFCRSGTIPIEAALLASNFPVNFFNKDKFLFLKLNKFESFDFDSFFEKEDEKINKKPKESITAADQSFSAVSSAKKNAKIAGIQKSINFSRKEPEWLEIKFKEGSVDALASFPPSKGRARSEKQVEKILDEIFYQADFILKKKGIVALLLKDAEPAIIAAEKHGFKVKETRKIMQGKEELTAAVFAKAL